MERGKHTNGQRRERERERERQVGSSSLSCLWCNRDSCYTLERRWFILQNHMAQTFAYLPALSEIRTLTHTHTHIHTHMYRPGVCVCVCVCVCATDRVQPQASTPLVTNYLDTLIHSYTPFTDGNTVFMDHCCSDNLLWLQYLSRASLRSGVKCNDSGRR